MKQKNNTVYRRIFIYNKTKGRCKREIPFTTKTKHKNNPIYRRILHKKMHFILHFHNHNSRVAKVHDSNILKKGL